MSARPAASSSPTSDTVHQHQMVEWTFQSSVAYADPFAAVELDAVVTDPGGTEHVVPGFWAGGSTWRVRYASPLLGQHRYRTRCTNPDDTALHDQAGTVDVVAYGGDNPLFVHGPVDVAPDRRHLQHRDGTPFMWLGDTWWMALTKRLHWPDEVDELIADRVAKGFTVVQIVAGLYPDMEPFDQRGANEAGFPWTSDFATINPAYFDAADRRFESIVAAGIVPCIVGSWGFFMEFAGPDVLRKHWRYLVARYSALPVVWCVAGEGLMLYYLEDAGPEDVERKRAELRRAWGTLARYIRSIDPAQHPLTIHPTQYGREQVDDPTTIDFEMLQTGHGGYASLAPTVRMLRASLDKEPRMPVFVSEVNYEGIVESGREEQQRFLFWTAMLSGAFGHTYGANGLWQVNGRDEPYGKSPHGTAWGGPAWDGAARLPGSQHLGVAKRVLEQFRWWRFERHDEWADPIADEERPMAAYAAGIPGEVRIVFVPAESVWTIWSGTMQITHLEPDTTYQASFVDPKTGEASALGDVRGGA